MTWLLHSSLRMKVRIVIGHNLFSKATGKKNTIIGIIMTVKSTSHLKKSLDKESITHLRLLKLTD